MPGLVSGDHDQRGFRRIVFLLIWLVIIPTGVLLTLAILMLVFYEANLNLVFGILMVTLGGCLVTGTVLTLVFLRREANLSRLQTDFVSKVSHELRTPLTSIRMFAEMLEQEKDPERMAVCLDVLQRETVRLSDRIERLLDWGRMESGRRVYELEPDTIGAIVDAAIEVHDTATLGRGAEVSTDIPEELPQVMVDRAAMVDAVSNLLSNAWKYTGEDKQIRIVAQDDGKWVRIAVRDNGHGIPKHEQRQVFDKFYRSDDRLAREVEGSGLGLAIVRHVVRGHGGKVEVESDVGVGSTFTILLPRAKPSDVAAFADTAEPAVVQ
jgi:two-component system phosphate regulon sensor histidine kinase PhoR